MKTKRLLMRVCQIAALAVLGALFSCSSEDSSKPTASQAKPPSAANGIAVESYTPGEAGGVLEETVKASATVEAIDPATRKITLLTQDGSRALFTAPPEMHNFDQL